MHSPQYSNTIPRFMSDPSSVFLWDIHQIRRHTIFITLQHTVFSSLFMSSLLNGKMMSPTLSSLDVSLTSLLQLIQMIPCPLLPLLPLPYLYLLPRLVLHCPSTPVSQMRRSLLPVVPARFGKIRLKYLSLYTTTLLMLFLYLQMVLFLFLRMLTLLPAALLVTMLQAPKWLRPQASNMCHALLKLSLIHARLVIASKNNMPRQNSNDASKFWIITPPLQTTSPHPPYLLLPSLMIPCLLHLCSILTLMLSLYVKHLLLNQLPPSSIPTTLMNPLFVRP